MNMRKTDSEEACEDSYSGDSTTCEDDGQGGAQGSLPEDSLDESLGQDDTTSTTDESDRSYVRNNDDLVNLLASNVAICDISHHRNLSLISVVKQGYVLYLLRQQMYNSRYYEKKDKRVASKELQVQADRRS